jgi:hypothetical protein
MAMTVVVRRRVRSRRCLFRPAARRTVAEGRPRGVVGKRRGQRFTTQASPEVGRELLGRLGVILESLNFGFGFGDLDSWGI